MTIDLDHVLASLRLELQDKAETASARLYREAIDALQRIPRRQLAGASSTDGSELPLRLEAARSRIDSVDQALARFVQETGSELTEMRLKLSVLSSAIESLEKRMPKKRPPKKKKR